MTPVQWDVKELRQSKKDRTIDQTPGDSHQHATKSYKRFSFYTKDARVKMDRTPRPAH